MCGKERKLIELSENRKRMDIISKCSHEENLCIFLFFSDTSNLRTLQFPPDQTKLRSLKVIKWQTRCSLFEWSWNEQTEKSQAAFWIHLSIYKEGSTGPITWAARGEKKPSKCWHLRFLLFCVFLSGLYPKSHFAVKTFCGLRSVNQLSLLSRVYFKQYRLEYLSRNLWSSEPDPQQLSSVRQTVWYQIMK